MVTATSAFAAHWGRSTDELVGLHLVGLWTERHRAEVTATLVRLVEGTCELEHVDTRSSGPDGKLRVMRTTFGRLPDQRGRTTGVVCVIDDATDSIPPERRRRAAVDLIRSSGQPPTGSTAIDELVDGALRRAGHTGAALSLLRCQISGIESASAAQLEILDEALVERLTSRMRPSDAIHSVADDTVLVVAENLGDEQDAAGVAYRLLSAAVEPIVADGEEFTLELTIGIAVADAAASPANVIDAAATALADALADGVGGFRLVDLRDGLAA